MSGQGKPGMKLRNRRRELGLSQRVLAEQMGATASALCMFEKGKHDALSVERLNKACELLELPPGALLEAMNTRFCPNADCPTHHPFMVGEEFRLMPEAVSEEHDHPFCRWCGEVLESCCGNCGADFEPQGAFCGSCGVAYLSVKERSGAKPSMRDRVGVLKQERHDFEVMRGNTMG